MLFKTLLVSLTFALTLADQTYTEVSLSYYHSYMNNYGSSVCNLNYPGNQKERYLTFKEIQSLDPQLHCHESDITRCNRRGCVVTGKQVNCMLGGRKDPVSCEKVKRVCEGGMLGKLQYGTCVPTPAPKGDCCFKLEDPTSGLWTKDRTGSCPFLCLGVIDPLGGQWCKSCSCSNADRGTGQGGSKSYNDLC